MKNKIGNWQLIKESVIASLLVLLVTFCIGFIPFKFEFLKVIRQGFLDIDIYDLYYSGKSDSGKRSKEIVLVELEDNRTSITEQINIINQQSPAVIAIDAVFQDTTGSEADKKLVLSIQQSHNVVLASRLSQNKENEFVIKESFFKSEQQYMSGFTNLIGNEYSVVRMFSPFVELEGKKEKSFCAAIVERFSVDRFNNLSARKNDVEIINYGGNLERYNAISKMDFAYFQNKNQLKLLLKDKVVLLGFFKKQEPPVLEDLYFTPVNKEVAGKSYPDMYGVVIQANILSMILDANYAIIVPSFVSYLFAFIINFFLLHHILNRYKENLHLGEGILLLLQLLIIAITLYFFLQVYNWFLMKVSLLPIILSTVISVEFFGLYEWFAKMMNRKFKYHTVFSNKVHNRKVKR